ncbi:MAG: zinc/iron permease [Bacteroidetes bacterium B1(2017)]|nr:MAG: zinc/iron permease [Bacteroidetes bacterium B1(2017)]
MSLFWFILLPFGPLLGGALAIKTTKKYQTQLNWFLAFAGAYLLGITLLNLIPEVFQVFNPYKGLLVLAGFFFQIFLEKYSEGIEHGHMHVHHHLKNKVIPIGIVASMSLHSFTEGIPLGALWMAENTSFYSLLFGIIIHEVPAAFALISILKGIHLEVKSLRVISVVYGVMALLGACLSLYLRTSINEEFFDYFMAFVIGTFLHISTTILFENSEQHHFSKNKLFAVILGIGLAALISIGLHS